MTSFCSRFCDAQDHSIYFDTLRECYEAFVIYHFFTFIIVYLEQARPAAVRCSGVALTCAAAAAQHGSVESLLARKEQQPHLFPLSLMLKPWRMGPEFQRKCKAGVLNYVIIRPVTAAVAFVSEARGMYGEGELFNATKTYTYVVAVNSFSQSHAIYCLILLFQATRAELEPIKPVAKFVCVKAVIFFSFWQSIAIVVMVHMHVLSSRTLSIKDYDIKDVSSGLQEFIICVEMFVAALAHQFAFPVSDFGDAVPAEGSKLSSVLDVLDMSDVFLDVRDRAESVGGRMVGRLKDATGSVIGPPRAKLKLDHDGGDLDDGDDSAAVRLLPVGSERSTGGGAGGEGGVVADRGNMPFLAAGSHQQRRTGLNIDVAIAEAQHAGPAGLASPRAAAAAPAAAASTVSIGGRVIALQDLLPSVRSPRSPRGSTRSVPERISALAQTCALQP